MFAADMDGMIMGGWCGAGEYTCTCDCDVGIRETDHVKKPVGGESCVAYAVQSTISQSSPLTRTQDVVRIGGAGVGWGGEVAGVVVVVVVGIGVVQSIRTSSSQISSTIFSKSLVTLMMSRLVLSASSFTRSFSTWTSIWISTSLWVASLGPRLRIFCPSGESNILILMAMR